MRLSLVFVVGLVACGDAGSGSTPSAHDDTTTDEMGDDMLPGDGDGDGAPDDAPPFCAPGSTQACYTGSDATRGVAPCQDGVKTCLPDGSAYGSCEDEVLPATLDLCGNGIDDDCNGAADDSLDLDGDGWARCDGDCCDLDSDGCASPISVNPGAYDYPGDALDDDCSGSASAAEETCDQALTSSSVDAADYARALDVCQATTASAPLTQRRWGLLSARLSSSSGTGTLNANARSIRTAFGGAGPQRGSALAVLSTGHAAAVGQVSPSYVAPQNGTDFSSASTPPADWLALNGDAIPTAPGCPALSGGNVTYDSILLELSLRVPTNARSFSLSLFFLSAEYPEYVCTAFNDAFLALLDSQAQGNPSDKNLATYAPPAGGLYPVNVNLAHGNTGMFQACTNGPIGCSGANASTMNGCASASLLAGTGHDTVGTGCSTNNQLGGGTGWLVARGNVVPGETATLRLVLWDTADGIYDSTVLLDGLNWSPDPVTAGTAF